jgi:hypothetical protein
VTTIAWDGKTLAADRLRTVGSVPTPATKIFRAPKACAHVQADFVVAMYGVAGDSGDAVAFRQFVEDAGAKPALKNCSIIVIDVAGRCWFSDESLRFHLCDLPSFGVGSGSEFAEGAMEAGKSAIDAVLIASKRDVRTGMGIDVLELEQ